MGDDGRGRCTVHASNFSVAIVNGHRRRPPHRTCFLFHLLINTPHSPFSSSTVNTIKVETKIQPLGVGANYNVSEDNAQVRRSTCYNLNNDYFISLSSRCVRSSVVEKFLGKLKGSDLIRSF
jgi:hypothetical protein